MMLAPGLALLAAAAPIAGESCARPLALTELIRTATPNSTQMEQAYPRRTGLPDGRAEMLCSLTAAGRLARCVVSEEDPRGYGFGAAALKLARYFAFTVRATDGRPVAGRCVRIPIRWSTADS